MVGLSSACQHESPGGLFRSVEGCPINRMYRPLCGTDNCTYINDDALACAQMDDRRRNLQDEEVVRMAYSGMCNEEGNENNEV
ncbi:hypothetical protein Pmani_024915 [Petrolisthes manimaculis]|uniref:Kazal-like domain-containing protein n=1 Tax=Petrolisthes manimaculis TaxID=1843537 RepID=A0AAE1P8U1_9EUCA|nr:hypothetical protein Pmani_024915 [Petrolisthes manimaculis]